MTPAEIQRLIETGLPGARVEVRGADGMHFEALVVSEEFRGLPTVRQHQRVYQILGGRMGREIHALALRTSTPDGG
ncbi:MAG TPA: BolA/IbaG family iron-sulfur metabolism protein [Gammaproteobacteria bacterium]|nr:BolA/IbaG family iron-sulfur metabolism protein [Gammaproteobacteria bacterium]